MAWSDSQHTNPRNNPRTAQQLVSVGAVAGACAASSSVRHEIVSAVVTPHARVNFDGNHYSVSPEPVHQPVTVRAIRDEICVLHEDRVLAHHARCYERGQLIVLPDHRLAAIAVSQRSSNSALEHSFDALEPKAHLFHLGLKNEPVRTSVHLRCLLNLA
jgi:hypothetical protein